MGAEKKKKPSRIHPVWVAALALVCSAWAMRLMPLDHVQANRWGDTLDHFNVIQGAAQALREGQFPLKEVPNLRIRVAPSFKRLGLFLFYGNLPMTLSGLLVLAGFNAWHAFALLVLAGFLAGFLGVYALAREWGAGQEAALGSGVLYTLAPYHLLALSFRGASTELFVFGILPWVFLFSLQAARRPALAPLIAGGLAWAALMHTHHVFHAWTLPFFVLGLALSARLEPKKRFAPWRALAAYGLGLALSLWFVLPGVLVGRHFLGLLPPIPHLPGYGFHPWFELKALLSEYWVSPWLGLDEKSDAVYQVGWPLLAGFVAFLIRRGRDSFRQPFFWLFLGALFFAWGPMAYWDSFGPLQMVQTKSRFLLYVALFGSVLGALALEKIPKAWGLFAVAAVFLLQAFLHEPYQRAGAMEFPLGDLSRAVESQGVLLSHQPYPYYIPVAEADRMASSPDLETSSGALLARKRLQDGLEILSPAGFPSAASFRPGRWSEASLKSVEEGSLAVLPAAWYPGLYRLEINGHGAPCGRVGNRLAARLPQGDVELRYCLAGYAWANILSLAAWAALLILLLIRIADRVDWLSLRRLAPGLLMLPGLFFSRSLAANESFDYAMLGASRAAWTMEFAQAERCFLLALDNARSGEEKALALAGAGGARLDQGLNRGVEAMLKRARSLAERCGTPRARFLAWLVTGDLDLRQGRWKEAEKANQQARAAALAEPPSPQELADRLCLQEAGIIAGRDGAKKAFSFLEKTWEAWAFRPDYLYTKSRENLGRAALLYLDLKRVDRAFVVAAIYSDRASLVVDPCPEPMLKAEMGAAEICARFGRARAAGIFYKSAATRRARLFGPADAGARRLGRMAAAFGNGGHP